MTPAQRHAGLDQALLDARTEVYEKARQAYPQRWSRQVRQWTHVGAVPLYPDTPQIKERQHTQKAA